MDADVSTGFAPIARADARVLILGSLPGQRSIEAGEYYAHPQNAFWRIMAELFDATGDYARRCERLRQHRIAVWDVLYSSVRPGSMDAAIREDSARPNDFAAFFAAHRGLERIVFNGAKAEQMFARLVVPELALPGIAMLRLPSTSPAYAAMPFSGKLAAWRDALGIVSPVRGGGS